MLDILIKNGWIADGTGNPTYPANVAIQGDRIADVERLSEALILPQSADCPATAAPWPTSKSPLRATLPAVSAAGPTSMDLPIQGCLLTHNAISTAPTALSATICKRS